ncbi:caspase domain-containing protein [Colletotrichum scovillei]|uniref:Caspase domain-containing protein n=3 Tax=Colletotrichum acutatum species complex TaxID=2707335 RepID=A0A9P9XAE5_9PEZI|nr:caspase domain-containing protein [Colletotrichum scovillei]XP_060313751.1 caspase domain-containing protein [Colletotrichum costaricense]XP_060384741.1 caspase domain-containing protein [Colletotrichum tamarilloi]XP_060405714.1 caspase domain-containing protein [Colletotrichum abscissum]KAF4775660.1 caspase domain-containing protein [Colletotrichum scovillei]KAI3545977.1 caspase domain-containing protein [Colletotrichum abscissum]KAK1503445.1 caspase domain-containing protein [Colletotric
MSGYPGQYGGYQGGPPPQQQYAQGGYYPYELRSLFACPLSVTNMKSKSPPQQGYNGYPPAGSGYGYQQPSPQPYGYNQPPPPQQYGGYQQPPPQPNYNNRPGVPTVNSNAYMHGNHNAPPPPPSQPQRFGHGAPSNYNFQYSNCTGRRKALLIGINYFGQRGQLRGCINDVKNMSAYLVDRFGYKREDMVILTDDQQNPMSQPTKQNLLRAMHWLVKDARPNDSLFFHYSGHGGQTKDLDGDEPDGYDEVIYPVDFRQTGHITDDEMHRIMVQPLQAGVRLTAIFDSCHSGTALDLPYIYSTQGILKEPNLAKEAGQGLLGAISSYSQGDLGGVASNIMGFFKKATTGEDAYQRTMATKTSPADVIMLSGSKDDQTSADATIASQATGAMSWAFITAMKKNPQQSYVQLLNSIRDELASRYTQKPQLSCSHPLNTNLLFVM